MPTRSHRQRAAVKECLREQVLRSVVHNVGAMFSRLLHNGCYTGMSRLLHLELYLAFPSCEKERKRVYSCLHCPPVHLFSLHSFSPNSPRYSSQKITRNSKIWPVVSWQVRAMCPRASFCVTPARV